MVPIAQIYEKVVFLGCCFTLVPATVCFDVICFWFLDSNLEDKVDFQGNGTVRI